MVALSLPTTPTRLVVNRNENNLLYCRRTCIVVHASFHQLGKRHERLITSLVTRRCRGGCTWYANSNPLQALCTCCTPCVEPARIPTFDSGLMLLHIPGSAREKNSFAQFAYLLLPVKDQLQAVVSGRFILQTCLSRTDAKPDQLDSWLVQSLGRQL